MSQRLVELWREALPHLPAPIAFDVRMELGDYHAFIARALELKKVVGAQKRKARRLCDKLLSLPPEHQLRRIRRSGRPHWSEPLARELIRRSRVALFENPREAVWLARLSWEVAWKMRRAPKLCGGVSGVYDLHALTLAHLGNAHRLACEWSEAEAAFEDAFARRKDGTADPLLEAELRSLHGSYLRDRRLLREAVSTLTIAARLYRNYAGKLLLSRALVKLATVFNETDEVERAYTTNLEACRMVDELRDPRLAVAAWNNQAFLCTRLDRFEEAARYLEEIPLALRHFTPGTSDRAGWSWVRGRVAQGLRDPRTAEAEYREAMEGYRMVLDHFSFALVALDLARLYFEEHRHADLSRAAEAAWTGLESQGLHREAEAALQLLVGAARREEATAEVIRAAAEALRRNPLERRPPVRPRR